MQSKFRILPLVQVAIFILSFFSDSYGPLVLAMFFCTILMILDNLGKGYQGQENKSRCTAFLSAW